MESTTDTFLLTRHWRDTERGLELVLWAGGGEAGPVRIVLPEQEAVCFIPRGERAPESARRREVELATLTGIPVDALYFRSGQELRTLRETRFGTVLLESDVRPPDRFLMERMVTGPMLIRGEARRRGQFTEFVAPRVRPGACRPAFRFVSLDIETSGLDAEAGDDEVWSIAVSGGVLEREEEGATPYANAKGGTKEDTPPEIVFMVGAPPANDAATVAPGGVAAPVSWQPDEASAIRALLAWVAAYDPDILIGWNVTGFDLRFLQARCRRHRIAFTLGRAGTKARVLDGAIAQALAPGRVVIDGIEGHRAAFWGFEDESLDAVAQQLLGRVKLIRPADGQSRFDAIRELHATDRAALAAYNLEDCRLVRDIFAHTGLIDFMIERSRLTGLSLGRAGGSVAAFDHLYLPRLHRRGRVAPDVGAAPPPGADGVDASPGGYVLESRPGLHRNIALLDFKSLYPSIIRTFRIDPLGLAAPGNDPVPGFDGAMFAREDSILPELITSLWERRDEAKRDSNQSLQLAIKILMNSFYGVLGTRGCRFYDPRLASSITRRGHEIIRRSEEFIRELGYEVIYGDTDSLFVRLDDADDNGAPLELADDIARRLNEWWRARIEQHYQVESCLEIEVEALFERFLMPTIRGVTTKGTKKRYAGLTRAADGAPELVFKGLETVRTDWTPLARRFQRELYRKVFLDEPYDDYVREIHDDLFAGKFDDDLVYRKRMRRPIDAYTHNVPPHVQAARLLPSFTGPWIEYVITTHGPMPLEAMEDDATKPDYVHYRDRQLAPVADGILHFLDTTFERLTTAQLF